MTFEQDLFRYIETAVRRVRAEPLNLGGVTSSGGGAGGPPGGFTGVLPQTKVAYDLSELAASGISISGATLLDNLNHIRYRIEALEDSAGSINIYKDDILIASNVTVINFAGDVAVLETASGEVLVTISGGSGSSTLAELTDVSISGQTDGQVLTWEETSSKWIAKTPVTSSGLAGGAVKRKTGGNVTIDEGYSLIVSCDYEIELGDTLEIADDGILEVT